VVALNHDQAALGELGELEQIERRGIELQMPQPSSATTGSPRDVSNLAWIASPRLRLFFEALHLVGLAQHRHQQAAHQHQDPLLQLKHPLAGSVEAAVRQRQPPDAFEWSTRSRGPRHRRSLPWTVLAVLAGSRAADRVLTHQHGPLDLAIEELKHRLGFGIGQNPGPLIVCRCLGLPILPLNSWIDGCRRGCRR